MSAFQLKFYAVFLLVFLTAFPSFGLAVDISALVAKRLSQDGKTLDLSRLKIGTSGAKQLAGMESIAGITTLYLQGSRYTHGKPRGFYYKILFSYPNVWRVWYF